MDTHPPGKPGASSIPQCPWLELQTCLLRQSRRQGRSKEGPALPQQAGQVLHITQEAGVGGGDVSFARWGWGPDLSGAPWMNQPDHSCLNCNMVQTSFSSSSLPSPLHAHFPFLSFLGRGVPPGQWLRAHLWSWWLSWVLVLDLQPLPSRYSIPKRAAAPARGGGHVPCPEDRTV